MGGRGRFVVPKSRKRYLCGIGCLIAGALVLVCFLPDWLFALLLAGILFRVGAALLCGTR